MNRIIRLSMGNDQSIFRTVNSAIFDNNGEVSSIIGKLTDVSEDEANKGKLLGKSQLDGLTGLYNPETTKDLIITAKKHY